MKKTLRKVFDQYVENMRNEIEQCYALAREQLRVSAERRKRDYDIRVRKIKFDVGDWVWYWYPRRYKNKSPKWQHILMVRLN